jgi:hypothetical protein
MALEMTIYNRQPQTSRTGKQYIGYVVAFAPGQRGAIPAQRKSRCGCATATQSSM